MIKFETDENLGQVVDMTNIVKTCFGVEPIVDIWDLRMWGGGSKFSMLCGFRFISKNPNTKFPKFSIAFVSKLRSKFYRQAAVNPSQWFAFKSIGMGQKDVLDRQALLVNYGFDVDKFFQSDLFQKSARQMQMIIARGVKTHGMKFLATRKDPKEKEEAYKLLSSIAESVKLITVPNFNDKYYTLKNFNVYQDVKKPDMQQESELTEADDREPLSHALDFFDIKASTANTCAQDGVSVSIIEDEAAKSEKKLDEKISSAMKDIYGESEEIKEENEEDRWKCEIRKEKNGMEDEYAVYTLNGSMWVASFADEISATEFANEYPMLRMKNKAKMDAAMGRMQ